MTKIWTGKRVSVSKQSLNTYAQNKKLKYYCSISKHNTLVLFYTGVHVTCVKCYTSVSIVRRLIRKRSSWIDDLDELIAITAERKFGHVSNNENYKKLPG